jgi:phosphatidate phosphatase APP1
MFITLRAGAQTSNLRQDEQVVFYPSYSWQSKDGKWWEVEIHGCVFEPESRGLALALLRKGLALGDVEMTGAQRAIFAERARLFMVDNERGKRIAIALGNQTHVLDPSGPNGHFTTTLRLSIDEANKLRGDAGEATQFQAILAPGDARKFRGVVRFFRPEGWFVISDIDDTIKVTEVTDSSATLRNTFLEPFHAVPGMAGLYREWEKAEAGCFYVSASPWQLYVPLAEFVHSNGFPQGIFQMKAFRLKDSSRASILEDPEKYKPGAIEPILKRFPRRRFVLVGDSGERDPEVYAGLARKHPQQVVRILIRNVTREGTDAPRYQKTFQQLPRDLWEVFDDPAAVTHIKGLN